MATWSSPLPDEATVGDAGHPDDHNMIVEAIREARTFIDAAEAALADKAASSHTHAVADVTGLQADLDGKAASSHDHAIADVTGLQAALDSKGTSNLELGTTASTALAGNTSIPDIPAELSAAEAEAGTSTATRTITAKVLADEIDRRIAAAAGA